jgi:sugar-specific transcriptional regulator TrmB
MKTTSVVVMSGSDQSDGESRDATLGSDELEQYVRDVMGWTAYQASAYVTVVRHGPLEPNEIVALSDIPQGRVYNVMGQLEGEAVNVQGHQPKRYQAQHPRSLLAEKQDEFNSKADAAMDHLEQQHEIQRERQEPRHPAWVITGLSGTKREVLDGLESANDRVLLVEEDGKWIQSNEMRDLERLVGDGVEVEVIGWSGWEDKLNRLVEEAGVSAWLHKEVDSSFSIVDGERVVMRFGREDTGVKIEDENAVNVFRTAFRTYREEATELEPHA